MWRGTRYCRPRLAHSVRNGTKAVGQKFGSGGIAPALTEAKGRECIGHFLYLSVENPDADWCFYGCNRTFKSGRPKPALKVAKEG
jgi:hypothetical protein